MKGEIWKDIPKLEMYFQVSNYGRIKRLAYELTYSDGRVYLKPQKIIKLVVVQIPNKHVGDTIYFLRTTLTLFGHHYNFSLARLVFNVFVKSFDMKDPATIILAKDGNGLNITLPNLKMATVHDKQKRIYDLGRSPGLEPSPQDKKWAVMRSIEVNSKPITKYSMTTGLRLATYRGISIAARKNGIAVSHIGNCARGREPSAGGFIWSYKNSPYLDLNARLKKKAKSILRNKKKFGKKITQYSMDGKKVATYLTISDAFTITGISTADISLVTRKKRKSAGGYYWKPGYGPSKINLTGYLYGEVLRAKNRCRTVKQYSVTGRYLNRFDSIKQAAEILGINKTSISCAVNGRQKTAGGFKWRLVANKEK